MSRYSEVYDVGPQYCPQCAGKVTEFIWLWQNKYYCSQEHIPKRPASFSTVPRTASGAINWSAYYEGYYGHAPGAGEQA